MLSLLRRGMVLAILMFAADVLPVQQQDDLQPLVTDLFPGQYWIEIDGALSNEGAMTQRVTEPGINNIRQSPVPFGVGDPLLSDPDQNDYSLGMDATIHDPEHPGELSWTVLGISFDNILGREPQEYNLISPEVARQHSVETPHVSASVLLPHRDMSRFQFIHNVVGMVYVEERQEADVFDRLIAFDFTAENELNEEVRVRGAIYDRRLSHSTSYNETPPGEVELAIAGELAAAGTDVLNLQTSPNEQGRLVFQFDSEFLGRMHNAPDDEIPLTLHAEVVLPQPVICDFANLQFSAGEGIVTLSVNDVLLEYDEMATNVPAFVICYDDEQRTTVSGSITFFQYHPNDLSRYLSFRLYYRAIPISPPVELGTMLDGLAPNTYVLSLDGALISDGALDASVYANYNREAPTPLDIAPGDDRGGQTYTLYIRTVAHTPDDPENAFPATVNLGFRNTYGDPPSTYPITELDTLEEDEGHNQRPSVDVDIITAQENPRQRAYLSNSQGRLYLSQIPVGDAVEYHIAFEFSLTNADGDVVHGRGAAFLIGPLLY